MTREEQQRMLLHPERYTDEQLDEMLSETDVNEPDIEAEWHKFQAKHFPQKRRSWGRMQIAAMFVGVVMIGGIALTAVHMARLDADEECVAYVYGEKTTDRETVMAEMKRTMGEMAEDDPQDNIEQQLNDLFSH